MIAIKVKLGDQIECCRCGYKWQPRVNDVRKCPGCGTIYFDVPKKKNPEKRYRRLKKIKRR